MPDVYNRNSVTKKGYNLLAESIATKKPITFTKVVVGDGDDTGLDINTMTGVVSPKMELPIGNGEKGGDGEYVIQAVLSLSLIHTGTFILSKRGRIVRKMWRWRRGIILVF